jgi:hypothetical protein
MKTTLDLDDTLLKEARKYALERGKTLTRFIEDALRMALAQIGAGKPRKKFKWIKVKGKPVPGVDFSDRDSLYEKMEGRE